MFQLPPTAVGWTRRAPKFGHQVGHDNTTIKVGLSVFSSARKQYAYTAVFKLVLSSVNIYRVQSFGWA